MEWRVVALIHAEGKGGSSLGSSSTRKNSPLTRARARVRVRAGQKKVELCKVEGMDAEGREVERGGGENFRRTGRSVHGSSLGRSAWQCMCIGVIFFARNYKHLYSKLSHKSRGLPVWLLCGIEIRSMVQAKS